ncbi:MAG: RNA-directed DNA polymerase [Glaciecola sp.]
MRFHWHLQRQALLESLHKHDYTLLPQSLVTKADGSSIHLWSSCDALVLKMLAMALTNTLVLSASCAHVKGHGGLKVTVNTLHSALPDYTYVMKTDVKSDYAHIMPLAFLTFGNINIEDSPETLGPTHAPRMIRLIILAV